MGQTDCGKTRPFGGGAEYSHVALPHFPAFIQARFCQKLQGHSSDATNYCGGKGVPSAGPPATRSVLTVDFCLGNSSISVSNVW